MADATALSELSGTTPSEANLLAIQNRIILNIYNLMEGKFDAVDMTLFGKSGHRQEPSKLLEQLRKMLTDVNAMLAELPVEIVSQWDNPEL